MGPQGINVSESASCDVSIVSHLPLQRRGGGMYAVTAEVTGQLRRHFRDVVFLKIPTPADYSAMLLSRVNRRLLGRRGSFFPFSPRVLTQVARQVAASVPSGCRQILFRSATRWIRCRPAQPYFVHLDAPFSLYCRNKQAELQFLKADLQRIQDEEAEFLEGAAGVFFESEWGREHALRDYQLRGNQYLTVGVAGGLQRPEVVQPFDPSKPLRLLTIAKHFRQKGGDLTGAAYRLLKPEFPDLTWHVIGGSPDSACRGMPGMFPEGQLNPDAATDAGRYHSLLDGNAILVHPTREDMNPLVLIEAAQFGCPVISVRDFAIPELVRDGETGLLLDRPLTPDAIAKAIRSLLLNPARLQSMSEQAVRFAEQSFSWDAIGQRMVGAMAGRTGDGRN